MDVGLNTAYWYSVVKGYAGTMRDRCVTVAWGLWFLCLENSYI